MLNETNAKNSSNVQSSNELGSWYLIKTDVFHMHYKEPAHKRLKKPLSIKSIYYIKYTKVDRKQLVNVYLSNCVRTYMFVTRLLEDIAECQYLKCNFLTQ